MQKGNRTLPAKTLGWVHGGKGPIAYDGYMGARGRGYMGEGVQLLTVGAWGASHLTGASP